MQVCVQTRDGKMSLYKSHRYGTAGDLKLQIGQVLRVPMGFSRLVFKKMILKNRVKLEDIGVTHMSTLELYWQPVIASEKRLLEIELEEELKALKGLLVHEHMTETYDHMLKTGGISKSRLNHLRLVKAASAASLIEPVPAPAPVIPALASDGTNDQSLEKDDEKDLEVNSEVSDDKVELFDMLHNNSNQSSPDELPCQDELAISDAALGLEPKLEAKDSQDWSKLEVRKESRDWSKLEEQKESSELNEPKTWDEILEDSDTDTNNEKTIAKSH
ncbi:uncharacterized protein LOC117588378 [Drosophila guanche]|uniref:Ubiquitin-like domain-containing protein n=1 Tax=Drosophila guanche TaxID=7266 RepID=A0A3B0K1L6_DROGU|nr:uncharacterized protein LOC117588378 [Drosophila guanche]SPP86562.1 Hypothetical predicted protein [Drosophila guanche]